MLRATLRRNWDVRFRCNRVCRLTRSRPHVSTKAGGISDLISVPKGGGALKGVGEKFGADLHTGTGNFTVPIALPPGRNGFQPQLNPGLQHRQRQRPVRPRMGIEHPGRQPQDLAGRPPLRRRDRTSSFFPARRIWSRSKSSSNVSRYRPRTEGLFALIERHANDFGYWQVKSKDGLVSTYGTDDASADWSDTAVIADPRNRTRVFAWKLTRTIDPFGNEIRYGYERDQGRDGERLWDQLYLKTIEYADHGPDSAKRFLVSVIVRIRRKPTGSVLRLSRRLRDPHPSTVPWIIVRTHPGQTRAVRSYRFAYVELVYLDEHRKFGRNWRHSTAFRCSAGSTSSATMTSKRSADRGSSCRR